MAVSNLFSFVFPSGLLVRCSVCADELLLFIERRGFTILERGEQHCDYTSDELSMLHMSFDALFFVARAPAEPPSTIAAETTTTTTTMTMTTTMTTQAVGGTPSDATAAPAPAAGSSKGLTEA